MTQEDKLLLLKDLSARLPYGVMIRIPELFYSQRNIIDKLVTIDDLWRFNYSSIYIENVKPYLRSMSSMTEEEWKEYQTLKMTDWVEGDINGVFINAGTITDWLNKYHFDFRGLIPKGLAIEVNEINNPYK